MRLLQHNALIRQLWSAGRSVRLFYKKVLCFNSFGWFYLRVRMDGSLPFYFTASNKTQIKIKRECAGNGAGKGKSQTGERGEYQAAEGILGLAGTWENPS